MKSRSQRGRMSKTKGKTGEREVVALLREHGFEARRGQQYAGGSDSPDVVHNIPGLYIEVKRCEKLSLYAALDQVTEDAGSGGAVPIIFHRRSQEPWVVILDARDFLNLLPEN